MTLAEIIGKGSNEEVLERLEYFRQRNYLVDDVCSGRTTFEAALKDSRKWWRILPFLKSKDVRNLEYLLSTSEIPSDYYNKIEIQEAFRRHWSFWVNRGIEIASRYIGLPVAVDFTASLLPFYLFGSDDAFYTGSTAGIITLGLLAFSDIRRKGKELIQKATALDALTKSAYELGSISGIETESSTIRRRRAAQHNKTGLIHSYFHDRFNEAAAEFDEAVKLDPLDFTSRRRLVVSYMLSGQPELCFAELREARVLYGKKVNGIDISMTEMYAKLLGDEGRNEEAFMLRLSLTQRVGVRTVKKFMRTFDSPDPAAITPG